jgi:hypothetical protein
MAFRSLRLVVPALVLGMALLVTGCSSSNVYDAGEVESYLKESQQGKVRGLALGEAVCPEDVELTEGVTFRCTLEIAGVQAPYTVRLTNVDADEVQVNLEPAKALIATSVVVDLVRKGLKAQYRDQATVNCGKDDLLVADPGTKIGCIVEIDGKQQQAVARVEDKDGTVVLER